MKSAARFASGAAYVTAAESSKGTKWINRIFFVGLVDDLEVVP
jgi:hypothetical protein